MIYLPVYGIGETDTGLIGVMRCLVDDEFIARQQSIRFIYDDGEPMRVQKGGGFGARAPLNLRELPIQMYLSNGEIFPVLVTRMSIDELRNIQQFR